MIAKRITLICCSGLISLLWACNKDFRGQDIPVAKVYDKYLTQGELREFIPRTTPPEDSLTIARNYINNWITKELLLHKAMQNLTDSEKNIRKQVEDYSASLLIHKYKEKLVSQKLASEVSESEINKYYEEHKFNFILSTPIVRAVMAIIPKSAPNIDKARKWFASKEAKDVEALEEYCITNARKYDNFNDEWIELRGILNLLPVTEDTWNKQYKGKSIIEMEDDENYYLLKIEELKNENEIAPCNFVKQDIKQILLNTRKMRFEEEIEKQITQEGIQKNHVKIY